MPPLGVALACALVLALAGCGSDDEPDAGAPEQAPASFFGVVPQAPLTDEDFAQMSAGGVGSIRIFLPWVAIDPSPEADDFIWDEYDRTVLGAAREGIDVLPFLFGSPYWVSQGLDQVDCETGCEIYAPRSEAALQAWGEFVAAAVDRYGPRGTLWAENQDVEARPIRVWQIWNEQNSPTFYMPEPDPAGYAKLLDVAAQQIRVRDPGAEVILGGMFGTPLEGESNTYSAWGFLRDLYEIEGTDGSFDGVAAHPYAAHLDKVKSQAKLIHDEVVRAGDDDASYWVTELGWASSGEDVPLNRGPEGQAESLTEGYEYFLDRRVDWNIEGVYWYAWRDTEVDICDWCFGAGLFTDDPFEPKPSWDAFTALTGAE